MEVKLTTLSENTANYGFIGEWGLSVLVEADGKKVLMDTGLGFSAVRNAKIGGVDLSAIDSIVLSHGHADHTGGLRDVLEMKGAVEIVAHPDIWDAKHAQRGPESFQYIGVPFPREELESKGARFKLTKEPVRLTENIMTSGEIPMTSGYEEIDRNLFIKKDSALQPDPLADDLALIIDADFGLVVILGCGHHGVVNTLRHAQKLTGKEMIYAVIGGIHLIRASDEQIEMTIAELQTMGIQKLGVSHCTGFKASCRLAQEFPGVFFQNNAGTRIELP